MLSWSFHSGLGFGSPSAVTTQSISQCKHWSSTNCGSAVSWGSPSWTFAGCWLEWWWQLGHVSVIQQASRCCTHGAGFQEHKRASPYDKHYKEVEIKSTFIKDLLCTSIISECIRVPSSQHTAWHFLLLLQFFPEKSQCSSNFILCSIDCDSRVRF